MKKVITYGTFDLFHQGHYNLLKRAKELGDYLIVGVTTEHFDESRGKVNVVDSVLERVENVRKTGFADEIILEDHIGQKIEDIQKYQIDIFTVGSDWIGTFDYLRKFCQVIYLERTPDISSTLIRKSRFRIVDVGIIGTGRIAPRFVSEARYVSGINISCAYNPVPESGKAFQRKCDIECETKNLDAFLERIEAVYIASPNETHYDYAKKALQCGKHVLCEKPVAFTRRQTEELYELAEEKDKVLLEGIKTAYCPGFQHLIDVALSGSIGEIRDVEACFTRLADDAARERTDAKYGGSFLEFGYYSLLPIIKLFGVSYDSFQIDSITGKGGIDLYTKVQIRYPDSMATAKMGVGVKSEGELVIAGTDGYILAQSPWWLTRHFEVHRENPTDIKVYEPAFQGDGLRYEISEFVAQINKNAKSGYKLTREEAIAMAVITESFMKRRLEQNECRNTD